MTARRETLARIVGLYGLADARASRDGDPVRMGARLLDAGCRLVQLRCKGWDPEDVAAAAAELGRRCHDLGATFLVNDHPEIAAQVDADGAHVGQTDAPAAEVRRILGPDRILGRSTNDPDQLRQAMVHADYVAFGPIFPTPHLSRPKTTRGLDGLRTARRIVDGRMPLVAIGGITPDRLSAVRAAGADAWAVIGALATAADLQEVVLTFGETR